MKRKYGFLLNRDLYRKVKKYDHAQFEQFCKNVYENGFNDGRKSVPGIDLTEIMEQIKSVKGIGDKRMNQIESAVATLFENQEGEKEHE